MNKKDFITCLAGKLPYKREEVEFLLDIVPVVLSAGLENDGKVKTPFGAFKTVTRKARRIRRIDNGELDVIPERQVIQFKPSKELENGKTKTS
jgi:nucleoid DNA-binding protein